MSVHAIIETISGIFGLDDVEPTEEDLLALDGWEAQQGRCGLEEMVDAVCMHASLNYETGGWAALVDCWSPEDIRDAIADAGSVAQALHNVRSELQDRGELGPEERDDYCPWGSL